MTTTISTPGRPPGWPAPPAIPTPPPARPTPLPEWATPLPGNDDWLLQRLFDNRIVLVRGVIDREAATRLTSQLLALDAASQRPIRLHIDSPNAEITAALLLADTLDMVRVSTQALVIGEVGGGTLALVMAAGRRTAYPHAHVQLVKPRSAALSGDVVVTDEQHRTLLAEFVERLARATGKPVEQIQDDLRRKRQFSAADAVEYGLLDEVATPEKTDV